MEKTMKALIIEKGKTILPLLEDTGCVFSCAQAHDALAAKKRIESDGYQLVIMNCQMPGLDGLSLVRHIRRRDFPGGVHIGDHSGCVYIIVTGCPDDETILNACLASGVDDVLARSAGPWEIKKSLRTAHRILSLNHLLSRTAAKMAELQVPAAIGRLVPGIAHEINNPLGFIDGNFSVLADYCRRLSEAVCTGRTNDPSDERAQKVSSGQQNRSTTALDTVLSDLFPLLDETRDGLERMKNLIRDLQRVSQFDDGHPMDIDINDCLKSVLNVLWNELKYKAVVNKHFDRIPMARVCPGQIHQAFMNLLLQTAHAMRENGEINITTSYGNGRITVIIAAGRPAPGAGDLAFITVDDRTEAGFDLLPARAVIRRHDGSLEMVSEAEAGVAFRVRLPAE
ncbi:MAG: response regulator [Thermodesulfobacteriota bacterium]